MTHLIKIEIDKPYENSKYENEIITNALLDLNGSFDLMKADHTFFENSEELLDYLENRGDNLKLHVTNFTRYLKEMLNELKWKFL